MSALEISFLPSPNLVVVRVKFSDSYPLGGERVSAAQLGVTPMTSGFAVLRNASNRTGVAQVVLELADSGQGEPCAPSTGRAKSSRPAPTSADSWSMSTQ